MLAMLPPCARSKAGTTEGARYMHTAWVSALLVLSGLGNARRPEEWEQATDAATHAFFCV